MCLQKLLTGPTVPPLNFYSTITLSRLWEQNLSLCVCDIDELDHEILSAERRKASGSPWNVMQKQLL